VHAETREFVVHLDTDVLDAAELPSVNVPGTGGLKFADARTILREIVKHRNLLALDIAQYNPDKDPDGSGAKKLVDLLTDALAARGDSSEAPVAADAVALEAAATSPVDEPNAPAPDPVAPVEEVADPAADVNARPSEPRDSANSAPETATNGSEPSQEPADTPQISSSQSSS
jgi:hypothetical protein